MCVKHVAFLHHHLPALLIATLATAVVFDLITQPVAHTMICRGAFSGRAAICMLLLLAVAASSLYFLPLYLGTCLPPKESTRRTALLDAPWMHF